MGISDFLGTYIAPVLSTLFTTYALWASIGNARRLREFLRGPINQDTRSVYDPHKSLLRQPLILVVVWSLASIALILGMIIAINTPLKSDLSATGFNQFLVAFKVPIGIFALNIPIVGLLAANHRSEQMASQNLFANHYIHRREFYLHLQSGFPSETLDHVNVPALFTFLFPASNSGIYSIDPGLIQAISNIFSEWVDFISEIQRGGNKVMIIVAALDSYNANLKSLDFLKSHPRTTKLEYNGEEQVVPESLSALLNCMQNMATGVHTILAFDSRPARVLKPTAIEDIMMMEIINLIDAPPEDYADLTESDPVFAPPSYGARPTT